MLCDMCQKRQANQTYILIKKTKIDICPTCAEILYAKNIRNFYGGRIYEFVLQLRDFRKTKENKVKRLKKSRSLPKIKGKQKVSA